MEDIKETQGIDRVKTTCRYTTGRGHAHEVGKTDGLIDSFFRNFGCKMFGTFNVRLIDKSKASYFKKIRPSKIDGTDWFWFTRISKGGRDYFGWVKRSHDHTSGVGLLEIITKEPIPEDFREGELEIELAEYWNENQIREWAKDIYWWQTFDFSPTKRAQSKFLWDTMNIVDWSGCSVLDIGCHYGYHSFQASKHGARVVGFDKGLAGVKTAKIIRDRVMHEDVNFVVEDPGGEFDIILYLSVHHQIDPNYCNLRNKIDEYKLRAKKYLFVELIVPPHFPSDKSMTEEEIDTIVGGRILARYAHKVRGTRKVYWIEKDSYETR